MARKNQNWNKVKAQIFDSGFSSISEFARKLDCTTEAVRLTTRGKCPRVKRRMEALLK